MLVCYFIPPPSFPAHRHYMGISSSSTIVHSSSDSDDAAAALFFYHSKSIPACPHHHLDTLSPGLRADCSQRSRIGRVAIYCATVFCLLMIYFPIPPKLASIVASSNDGFSQIQPPCILGCLPVSHRTTLCWKLIRSRSILGVSTHISALNNNTACVSTPSDLTPPG